jgi:hypothetical protein
MTPMHEQAKFAVWLLAGAQDAPPNTILKRAWARATSAARADFIDALRDGLRDPPE